MGDTGGFRNFFNLGGCEQGVWRTGSPSRLAGDQKVPYRRVMTRLACAPALLSLVVFFACAEGDTGRATPDAEPTGPVTPTIEPATSGTTALLQAVSPVDAQSVWASGHDGVVVRSVDGGLTWSTVPTPVGDSLQFRDVHAFSDSHAALLTAGTGPASRLYVTEDAGASWTLAYLMEDERGFLDCLDFWDERGIAYGDSFDGVPFVLRTEDAGLSWTRVSAESLPAAPEGEGGFAASGTCARTGPDGVGWIATGASGNARVLRTSDYGQTWSVSEVPVVRGDVAGLTTVSFQDARTGIALGGDLAQMEAHTANVAHSRDGGATWEAGGGLALAGPVYGSAWVPDTDIVVAVGPGGADWSPDGGATWMQLDTVDYWAVAFGTSERGWMTGPEGRITRVTLRR